MTKSGKFLPTLELSKVVEKKWIDRYRKQFLQKPNWIPCESQIDTVSTSVWLNWKERLFVERLEQKSKLIGQLLEDSKNDWEAVCFQLLAKNFGLNLNGSAFLSIAKSLSFDVLRKNWNNVLNLESLFLGMSGLLSPPFVDSFHKTLAKKFDFLKRKHQLKPCEELVVQFNRLRPMNFPTIRWVQLAQLYAKHKALFSSFIRNENRFNVSWLSDLEVSEYWKSHYVFGKNSAQKPKGLSKGFQDLILINTIIPLKFTYEIHIGKDPSELIFDWIQKLKPEKNSIVNGFMKLKIPVNSALDSQSLI